MIHHTDRMCSASAQAFENTTIKENREKNTKMVGSYQTGTTWQKCAHWAAMAIGTVGNDDLDAEEDPVYRLGRSRQGDAKGTFALQRHGDLLPIALHKNDTLLS